MNVMMIRLLSAISMAVVAILGADLSASTNEKTSQTTESAKKQEDPKMVPVSITEKTMDEVEASLGKATIVDARGSGDEMIQGAIFIAADADDKDIHAKLADKSAQIIVYCGNVKCSASMTLATRLVGMGYKNVCHYAGGIKEWTDNKKPVFKQVR